MPSARKSLTSRRRAFRDSSLKRLRIGALAVSSSIDLAGLRILEREDADVGKFLLARILDRARRSDRGGGSSAAWRGADRARRAGSPWRFEIGNQKHDRAPVQHVIRDVERLDGVGAAALRRVIEDIPHHAQHVAAALSWAAGSARPGRCTAAVRPCRCCGWRKTPGRWRVRPRDRVCSWRRSRNFPTR